MCRALKSPLDLRHRVEEIRQQAIAKNTAIEGDWRSD
jgi:hypothetical protein